MSIQDYDKAVKLIKENYFISDFTGGCSEHLINIAEKNLKLKFPQMYRKFLIDYGAGNFGAEEIFGIIKDDFVNSGIPDAIWFTLKQRKEIKLPNNLLIIYHTGGEEMFCLNFNNCLYDLEPNVIAYRIGVIYKENKYEIIANDFGDFLLQRVCTVLGLDESEKN